MGRGWEVEVQCFQLLTNPGALEAAPMLGLRFWARVEWWEAVFAFQPPQSPINTGRVERVGNRAELLKVLSPNGGSYCFL